MEILEYKTHSNNFNKFKKFSNNDSSSKICYPHQSIVTMQEVVAQQNNR